MSVNISYQDFSNPNINGLQMKGNISIGNQNYFVKLDDLSPSSQEKWADDFNYKYSSLSETIASLVLKNTLDPGFDYIDYQFITTKRPDGTTVAGTISKNFLKENEIEITLGSKDSSAKNVLIDNEDMYANQFYYVPAETRLKRFINLFEEAGVNPNEAKDFLLKQAQFDILTGNTDRLNNLGNFTVAKNLETGQGRLINMDYGRCVQTGISWSTSMEETNSLESVQSDDFWSQRMASNMTGNKTSILQGKTVKQAVEMLERNGIKPFKIDKEGLFNDLDILNQKIQETKVAFKSFAHIKIEGFKIAFEEMHDLYIDISNHQELKESLNKLEHNQVNER